MYYYTMFYHTIASDFVIQEAIPIDKPEKIDIQIEQTTPPQHVLDDIEAGYYDHITPSYMWFYLKAESVYYIENGNHIIVYHMAENIRGNAVLMGMSMAMLLTQRGFIAMHGGGLYKNGKGVIILGRSGSGKSTTMLELQKRGFTFMADDICAIDTETIELLPAFPVQKLCRDVVDREGLQRDKLRYIDETKDKFAKTLSEEEYHYRKEKLYTMIEIIPEEREEIECVEVQGTDKLKFVLNNIFCLFLVEKVPIKPEMMKKYIRIAQESTMYRIKRPLKRNTLREISDFIENKI